MNFFFFAEPPRRLQPPPRAERVGRWKAENIFGAESARHQMPLWDGRIERRVVAKWGAEPRKASSEEQQCCFAFALGCRAARSSIYVHELNTLRWCILEHVSSVCHRLNWRKCVHRGLWFRQNDTLFHSMSNATSERNAHANRNAETETAISALSMERFASRCNKIGRPTRARETEQKCVNGKRSRMRSYESIVCSL